VAEQNALLVTPLLAVSPWPNRTRSRGVPLLPVSPSPNRTGSGGVPVLPVSPWPNRTPLLAIPVLAASLSANKTGLAETATREMFAQGDIRTQTADPLPPCRAILGARCTPSASA